MRTPDGRSSHNKKKKRCRGTDDDDGGASTSSACSSSKDKMESELARRGGRATRRQQLDEERKLNLALEVDDDTNTDSSSNSSEDSDESGSQSHRSPRRNERRKGPIKCEDGPNAVGAARAHALAPVINTPNGAANVVPLGHAQQQIINEYRHVIHQRHIAVRVRTFGPSLNWEWIKELAGVVGARDPNHVELLPMFFNMFAAMVLDPPWGQSPATATPRALLEHIPLEALFPSSGLVLMWCPRTMLFEAVQAMAEKGFLYGEYVTLLRYTRDGSAAHASTTTTTLSTSTVTLTSVSRTMLIFKKNVPRAGLYQQRNPDVYEVWGSNDDEDDASRVSNMVPCVYDAVETMIPAGRMLEVWGNPSNTRPRWLSILPQLL